MNIWAVLKIQKKKFYSVSRRTKTQSPEGIPLEYLLSFVYIFFFAPEFIPRSLAGCLCGEKKFNFWNAQLSTKVWTVTVVLFLLLVGCSSKKGDVGTAPNPVDTSSVAFIPPVTTITQAPANNEVLTTSSVTFKWTGTRDVARFETLLDGGQWISTTGTSITIDYLDEGTHTFQVRAVHQNGSIEKTPQLRSFSVEAVTKDNSILFFPRRNTTALLNVISTYTIKCENFKNVSGLQLTLQFDPTLIDITDATNLSGSIFQKNSGNANVLLSASSADKKIINIVALPDSKGKPFSVSGSDVLLTLSVKPKTKGRIPISIVTTETLLRDSSNTNLVKGDFVNGLIDVQ